jgi:hypothetical protein
MRLLIRCTLLVLALSIDGGDATAQIYGASQTLRPIASGEGSPSALFGSKVAIDGDLAVIGDAPVNRPGFTLRTWRRVAGVWQYVPAADVVVANGSLMSLALEGTRVAYARLDGTASFIHIRSLQGDSWVSEYGVGTSQDLLLGASTAIAGNLAVFGEPGYSNARGQIRVLRRAQDGTWGVTYLRPSIVDDGASFGHSVAIHAGAIVVGAPYEPFQNLPNTGAAYVFELTMDTWTEVKRVTAATQVINTRFGEAVAISGLDTSTPDRILVAAPRDAAGVGAVYGFKRVAGNWAYSLTLTDAQAQADQRFGQQLALDGEYALIGAEGYDSGPSLSNAGAVYGVTFNSLFTSGTQVRLLSPSPIASAGLGKSIAIDRSGPRSLAGDPRATRVGNPNQGVGLLANGSASNRFPNFAPVFDLGQGLTNAQFGTLSIDGDALLVSAPNEDIGSQLDQGAVYVYRRDNLALYALETKINTPDGLGGDAFGQAVAVFNDIALIGAPYHDSLAGIDSGAVYVYRRSNGVWTLETKLLTQCANVDHSLFGRTLSFDGTRALIGELCRLPTSGDDFMDVAIRSSDGSWLRERITDYRIGSAVWDGDRAIIGIPVQYGGGEFQYVSGLVRQFRRDNGVWVQIGQVVGGQTAQQGFGIDVAYDNGLLGVASYQAVPANLYRRSGELWLPESTLSADAGGSGHTQAIAVRGDRVVLGADAFSADATEQGAVYVFQKVAGAWVQQQRLTVSPPKSNAHFGSDVALHADGTLFVAARGESAQFSSEGMVKIYRPPNPLVFKNDFE